MGGSNISKIDAISGGDNDTVDNSQNGENRMSRGPSASLNVSKTSVVRESLDGSAVIKLGSMKKFMTRKGFIENLAFRIKEIVELFNFNFFSRCVTQKEYEVFVANSEAEKGEEQSSRRRKRKKYPKYRAIVIVENQLKNEKQRKTQSVDIGRLIELRNEFLFWYDTKPVYKKVEERVKKLIKGLCDHTGLFNVSLCWVIKEKEDMSSLQNLSDVGASRFAQGTGSPFGMYHVGIEFGSYYSHFCVDQGGKRSFVETFNKQNKSHVFGKSFVRIPLFFILPSEKLIIQISKLLLDEVNHMNELKLGNFIYKEMCSCVWERAEKPEIVKEKNESIIAEIEELERKKKVLESFQGERGMSLKEVEEDEDLGDPESIQRKINELESIKSNNKINRDTFKPLEFTRTFNDVIEKWKSQKYKKLTSNCQHFFFDMALSLGIVDGIKVPHFYHVMDFTSHRIRKFYFSPQSIRFMKSVWKRPKSIHFEHLGCYSDKIEDFVKVVKDIQKRNLQRDPHLLRIANDFFLQRGKFDYLETALSSAYQIILESTNNTNNNSKNTSNTTVSGGGEEEEEEEKERTEIEQQFLEKQQLLQKKQPDLDILIQFCCETMETIYQMLHIQVDNFRVDTSGIDLSVDIGSGGYATVYKIKLPEVSKLHIQDNRQLPLLDNKRNSNNNNNNNKKKKKKKGVRHLRNISSLSDPIQMMTASAALNKLTGLETDDSEEDFYFAFKKFRLKGSDSFEFELCKREIYRISEMCLKMNHPNIIRFRGFDDAGRNRLGIIWDICRENVKQYFRRGVLLKKYFYKNDDDNDEDELEEQEKVMIHELSVEDQRFKADLSIENKCRILVQVANGCRYLHSVNIMHRDLKWENVLISPNGFIKICDFGTSKEFTNLEGNTQRVGTNWYSAPEVLFGQRYSKSCDVYSFGVMLYQLMYEVLDFKKVWYSSLLEFQNNPSKRPDLYPRPSQVPKYLSKLIEMCWRPLYYDEKTKKIMKKKQSRNKNNNEMRPDFEYIYQYLLCEGRGMKKHFTEEVFDMSEKDYDHDNNNNMSLFGGGGGEEDEQDEERRRLIDDEDYRNNYLRIKHNIAQRKEIFLSNGVYTNRGKGNNNNNKNMSTTTTTMNKSMMDKTEFRNLDVRPLSTNEVENEISEEEIEGEGDDV